MGRSHPCDDAVINVGGSGFRKRKAARPSCSPSTSR